MPTGRERLLRVAFLLGAVTDGLAVVPMLVPSMATLLWGFDEPTGPYRFAMGYAATLMLGWTGLLLWAYRRPADRAFVAALTVFVIYGLVATEVVAVFAGHVAAWRMVPTWILQAGLLALFATAYHYPSFVARHATASAPQQHGGREMPAMTESHDTDPAARARRATEFFGSRVPGQLGCVFDHSATDLVIGHIDVTPNLIAGTGFLFAPAVITLADTCAAIGCGNNIPAGSSFTTIELKTNFVSSARAGERVVCRSTPVHLGGQTHVWDATVTNESTGRTMALFRCTQMVLPPR